MCKHGRPLKRNRQWQRNWAGGGEGRGEVGWGGLTVCTYQPLPHGPSGCPAPHLGGRRRRWSWNLSACRVPAPERASGRRCVRRPPAAEKQGSHKEKRRGPLPCAMLGSAGALCRAVGSKSNWIGFFFFQGKARLKAGWLSKGALLSKSDVKGTQIPLGELYGQTFVL